jgi:hypothetical protein
VTKRRLGAALRLQLEPIRNVFGGVYAGGMQSILMGAAAAAFLCANAVAAPPADATHWVYYNGSMRWDGSCDWGVSSVNYRDASGMPLSGSRDIEVRSQKWGGWQPYFHADCQHNTHLCFDTSPYKYLIFSVKPTVSNQVFDSGFMGAGDTKNGIVLHLAAYCSGGDNPQINEWESCKVPLSAYELSNAIVLKFMIQDQSGLASNHWYVDNVGFTAN